MDEYKFSIAELVHAFVDITKAIISPEPPITQNEPYEIFVEVKNIGDVETSFTLEERHKPYEGVWSEWRTVTSASLFLFPWILLAVEANMVNNKIDYEFRTADDIYALTIHETIEGIFVGNITIDDEEVARDGTIENLPTDKELLCKIKNTGGVAQKLTLSLLDITVGEPGEVIWSGETDRAIEVGEEVSVSLPPFSYPGGSKSYKIVVELDGYIFKIRELEVKKPECKEGAHEVLEYCPDGVTEKRWRDCIAGKWVVDSQTCPTVPVKKPSELIVTVERHGINTIRPVTIELEWYDEPAAEWKPVSGYPAEVEDNPSKHTTFKYGYKHRVRAIRDYILTQLRSDWEEFDPLEWDEKSIKLEMRRCIPDDYLTEKWQQ